MTPEYAKKHGFRETEKGIVTWRITKYGTWDKTVRYAPYSKLTIGRDFPTRKKMRERIKGLLYEDLCETEREERMQRRYDDGGRVALEHLEDMRGEMVIHVNWHNPNGIQPFTIKDSNKDYFEDIVKKGWAFYSSKGAKSAAAEENRRERIESCVEHQHSPMTEEQSKDLRGEKYYVVGKRGEVMPTTTIDISAIRDGRAFWHGKDAHAWKQEKVIPSATQVAIEERVKAAPSETPAEKDARIKALVDGYIAKGGPITKEQLTDEVRWWLKKDSAKFYSFTLDYDRSQVLEYRFDVITWQTSAQLFWNKSDAEHAKWLADMQSQTTPITPEQGKMLRDGDRIYGFKYGCVDAEHLVCFENPVTVGCVDDIGIIKAGKAYFTRAAAQVALNKARLAKYEEQYSHIYDSTYTACVENRDWDGADRRAKELDKAEAEPLEWCERKAVEPSEESDDRTLSLTVDLQAPLLGCLGTNGKDGNRICGSDGWVLPRFGGWDEPLPVGGRARYRNPLWLAKHGTDTETKPTTTPAKPHESAKVEETNPTTVRGWLETIPDEKIREAALGYCSSTDAAKECTVLYAAIDIVTSPRWTEEGSKFWHECMDAD